MTHEPYQMSTTFFLEAGFCYTVDNIRICKWPSIESINSAWQRTSPSGPYYELSYLPQNQPFFVLEIINQATPSKRFAKILLEDKIWYIIYTKYGLWNRLEKNP